jgi:tyrosinase
VVLATAAPTARHPTSTLRFRRDASRLTRGQLTTLRQAFRAVYSIADDRGYSYHAGIHGLPLPIACDNAHGTPYFLPWHRAYLYYFERALRDQVPDAMLAWWDWRRRASGTPIPPAYGDRRAGSDLNPLASARVSDLALRQARQAGLRLPPTTRRSPGPTRLLPTNDQVEAALSRRDFLDFTGALEEIHNRIHVWVGGHMGQIPLAAFDPIFWAHHTMVDRIWRIWQLRHPEEGRPQAFWTKRFRHFA